MKNHGQNLNSLFALVCVACLLFLSIFPLLTKERQARLAEVPPSNELAVKTQPEVREERVLAGPLAGRDSPMLDQSHGRGETSGQSVRAIFTSEHPAFEALEAGAQKESVSSDAADAREEIEDAVVWSFEAWAMLPGDGELTEAGGDVYRAGRSGNADQLFAGTPARGAATSPLSSLSNDPPGMPQTFDIEVQASPEGGGTVTGVGQAIAGQERTVTAVPSPGFEFVEWTEDGARVSTAASYTFTVERDRQLVAVFSGAPVPEGGPHLLWQNANGAFMLWQLSGADVVQVHLLDWTLPQPGSQAVAVADFNGDGQLDLLFQNADGSVLVRLMNGLEQIEDVAVGRPEPGWSAVSAADFTGDGSTDILFQHAGGFVKVWEWEGTTVRTVNLLNDGEAVPEGWRAAGVADFSGDGQVEILWEHDASDQFMGGPEEVSQKLFMRVAQMLLQEIERIQQGLPAEEPIEPLGPHLTLWHLQGLELAGETELTGAVEPGWRVGAIGDFDADGGSDILWLHHDGQTAVWTLSALEPTSVELLGERVEPGWRMVGVLHLEPAQE